MKKVKVRDLGYYEANFSAIKLNLNLLLEYRFLNKPGTPGIIGGVSMEKLLHIKEGDIPLDYNKFSGNGRIGITMSVPLKGSKELPLRLLYQRTLFGASLAEYQAKYSNSVLLSIGYKFKL